MQRVSAERRRWSAQPPNRDHATLGCVIATVGLAAMPLRFFIYDESTLKRRLRLKHFQALLIFVAGNASGLWLSTSQPGAAMAAAPVSVSVASTAPITPTSACTLPGPDATRLRLDCELSPR